MKNKSFRKEKTEIGSRKMFCVLWTLGLSFFFCFSFFHDNSTILKEEKIRKKKRMVKHALESKRKKRGRISLAAATTRVALLLVLLSLLPIPSNHATLSHSLRCS